MNSNLWIVFGDPKWIVRVYNDWFLYHLEIQSDDFGDIGFRSKNEFDVLIEIASKYYFKLKDGYMINNYYQEDELKWFMILV